MTRSTRPLSVALVAAACGASLALLACSSDDTTPITSSTDAGNDGTVSTPDASTDAGVDSATTPDASDAATTVDASDAATSCTPFDAGPLDDATVQAGLDLVYGYGCAKCHQTTSPDAGLVLSGNDAHNFEPDAGPVYAKNLTPDPATGLGCWSNADIRRAILEGIDDHGDDLCVMPHFVNKGLDAGGADDIVAFLRTLPAVDNVIPPSVCPVIPDAGPATDAATDAAPETDAASDAETPDAATDATGE